MGSVTSVLHLLKTRGIYTARQCTYLHAGKLGNLGADVCILPGWHPSSAHCVSLKCSSCMYWHALTSSWKPLKCEETQTVEWDSAQTEAHELVAEQVAVSCRTPRARCKARKFHQATGPGSREMLTVHTRCCCVTLVRIVCCNCYVQQDVQLPHMSSDFYVIQLHVAQVYLCL